MVWRVEFDDHTRRDLRKLNPAIQDQIKRYLRQRIATDDSPGASARPCRAAKPGFGDTASAITGSSAGSTTTG